MNYTLSKMAASMGLRIFARVPCVFHKYTRKITEQTHNGVKVLFSGSNICQHNHIQLSTTSNIYSKSRELPAAEVKKLMERLTDKFSEARELMDDARESKGTVYFSEDMEEAQEAVEETLNEYKQFLEKLSDKQRQSVVASLGLRMEELKAQKLAMEEEIKHDD